MAPDVSRRNLLYAGGALVCGAGIADAAGGWNLVQPTVEHSLGTGTLHRASDRLVAGGLGPNDERSYYAQLITEHPTEELFPHKPTRGSDTKHLQKAVMGVDFDTSFLLLAQVRMKFHNRVGISSMSRPRWDGWRIISIPLTLREWGKVQPELVGADQLINTHIIQYKCDTTPKSGRAVLRGQVNDNSVQKRLSI